MASPNMLGKLLPIHIDGINNHGGKWQVFHALKRFEILVISQRIMGDVVQPIWRPLLLKKLSGLLICMTWALWTVGNSFQTRNLVFQSKMVREAFCFPPSTVFCSRNRILEIEEGGGRGPPYLQPVLCILPAFHNSGSRRGWELYRGSSARDVSSLPSLRKILLDKKWQQLHVSSFLSMKHPWSPSATH